MKVTAQEIARRVSGILPILAENAQACVEARSLVPASMKAMVDAGLFRIPQPSRVGGYELGLRTLAGAVTTVSETCPTSGWVLMVMCAHHFCLGTFPEQAQDDVFGGGRDGLVAGTLAWQGKAVKGDRWQGGQGRRRLAGQRALAVLQRSRPFQLGNAGLRGCGDRRPRRARIGADRRD